MAPGVAVRPAPGVAVLLTTAEEVEEGMTEDTEGGGVGTCDVETAFDDGWDRHDFSAEFLFNGIQIESRKTHAWGRRKGF